MSRGDSHTAYTAPTASKLDRDPSFIEELLAEGHTDAAAFLDRRS